MAWLRVDDRFTEHRKVIALRRGDRWTWLEILTYCARHGSGHVPANIADVLRHVTPALVAQLVRVGLLDELPDGAYEVHDWAIYNAQTIEERVAAYLESDPEATANEVHRAIGGKREAVLRAHAAIAAGKPNPGTLGTDEAPEAGTLTGSESGTQTGTLARARGPSPTPTPRSSPASDRSEGRPTPDDDAGTPHETDPFARLAAAGWTQRQLTMIDRADLPRAIAWLEHAERDPATRNPGGLAWSGYASSQWPPEARHDVAAGAMGTRSHRPTHAHVCPRCPPAAPESFKTEARLVEHLEVVHGQYRANGTQQPLADEPAVDVTQADT